MHPGRQIFIGLSTILTGISMHVIIGYLTLRNLGTLPTNGSHEGATPQQAAEMDRLLDQTHMQMTWALGGSLLALLLIGGGLLLISVGICRKLMARKRVETS
jgi:hypothetical protein